jgi:hypothetical protein
MDGVIGPLRKIKYILFVDQVAGPGKLPGNMFCWYVHVLVTI